MTRNYLLFIDKIECLCLVFSDTNIADDLGLEYDSCLLIYQVSHI